jgi:hypothetical protein
VKPITETINLNSLNQLRITLNEFQGKQRLDIRHWYREGAMPEDEWKPSKKGVNLSIDSIGEFRKKLDKVFSAVAMDSESGEF